jgi:hypothetical protein
VREKSAQILDLKFELPEISSAVICAMDCDSFNMYAKFVTNFGWPYARTKRGMTIEQLAASVTSKTTHQVLVDGAVAMHGGV